MKTYLNGSKCSYKEMDLIIKERDEMLWGNRKLHSSEVNSILVREVDRFLKADKKGVWQNECLALNAIQEDLNFTDVQIKTQLKNLCRYAVEKRFVYKPGTRQIIGAEYKHLHKRW